jgi:hypothetical protein
MKYLILAILALGAGCASQEAAINRETFYRGHDSIRKEHLDLVSKIANGEILPAFTEDDVRIRVDLNNDLRNAYIKAGGTP